MAIGIQINTEKVNDGLIEYDIYVTKEPWEKKMFIDLDKYFKSQEILELEREFPANRRIGRIICEFDVVSKTITFPRFFPFGEGGRIRLRQFLGKGIADVIHLLVSEDLLRHFPRDSFIRHEANDRFRINQY